MTLGELKIRFLEIAMLNTCKDEQLRAHTDSNISNVMKNISGYQKAYDIPDSKEDIWALSAAIECLYSLYENRENKEEFDKLISKTINEIKKTIITSQFKDQSTIELDFMKLTTLCVKNHIMTLAEASLILKSVYLIAIDPYILFHLVLDNMKYYKDVFKSILDNNSNNDSILILGGFIKVINKIKELNTDKESFNVKDN